jgi:hypothetical protein
MVCFLPGGTGICRRLRKCMRRFSLRGTGLRVGCDVGVCDVGVIDMRRIAPTVAGVLGVALPTAPETKLGVAP